ncbi:MAG TPA: flagellar hook protein FlgE [Gemmataceae bacterium]|nr:flagellar hook protein FlgE [Gemmataceae bacterium]
MAAFGSLLAGVTGLNTNQQMLDVVGNNLANSNTTAYKGQSISFEDLFYQTLQPATPSTQVAGGTDPIQVGFGTKMGTIQNNLAQGTLQPTGNDLDMGLQGAGYFQESDGANTFFTRAGSFTVDSSGFLRDPSTGFNVLRFGNVGEPSAAGVGFQVAGDPRIQIPFGSSTPGQVTANLSLQGNLDATAALGTTVPTAIQIFDSKGTGHTLTMTFTKTANADPTQTPPTGDQWTVSASVPPSEGTVTGTLGPITFNSDGSPASFGSTSLALDFSASGASATQTINFNLGTASGFAGLTEFGGNSTAAATNQDGFASGTLTSVSIGKDGVIKGVFTNGKVTPLAQLAIADFSNPGGLARQGNNLYTATTQSGQPLVGVGGSAGRGEVQQGVLEQSNVDVAAAFTQLIIAQRGYEVNARTITVSDQVLQDLTQIIR